jgi:hypothetical protein
VALTDRERYAQRVLIGVIRHGGGTAVLTRDHLGIWRERGSEEWKAGTGELSALLADLAIPHTVVDLTRPATSTLPARAGQEIRIAWDDLHTVVRWMPSFQKLIDAIRGDSS